METSRKELKRLYWVRAFQSVHRTDSILPEDWHILEIWWSIVIIIGYIDSVVSFCLTLIDAGQKMISEETGSLGVQNRAVWINKILKTYSPQVILGACHKNKELVLKNKILNVPRFLRILIFKICWQRGGPKYFSYGFIVFKRIAFKKLNHCKKL